MGSGQQGAGWRRVPGSEVTGPPFIPREGVDREVGARLALRGAELTAEKDRGVWPGGAWPPWGVTENLWAPVPSHL